jgi:hypothetical protein
MPLSPPWTLTDTEWLDHIYLDMSRRQLHSLTSHLMRALQHLLKWQYQPTGRQAGHSWADSICAARKEARTLLARHPSLRPQLGTALARAYPHARREAQRDTGLPLATFPETCPWTPAQVFDDGFWPEGATHSQQE